MMDDELQTVVLEDEPRDDAPDHRERCAWCDEPFEGGERCARFMRAEGRALHQRCVWRAKSAGAERERVLRVLQRAGAIVSRGAGMRKTAARIRFAGMWATFTWQGGPRWCVELRDERGGQVFIGHGTIGDEQALMRMLGEWAPVGTEDAAE